MSESNPTDIRPDLRSEAARTERAARLERKPEMAQHEMLDPGLPKKDVADGLEDFDGDEA